jgi:hypothetical protein
MNEAEVSRFITETFEGVDVVNAMETSFFFYNPDPNVPPDHKFPFVTLVTSDLHDQFSDLNRPEVFRLNIGLSKETFGALFGDPARFSGWFNPAESGVTPSGYDFTALDQLMPHPVYAGMCWVCILNPSNETFTTKVRPLLTEAYERTVDRHKRKATDR